MDGCKQSLQAPSNHIRKVTRFIFSYTIVFCLFETANVWKKFCFVVKKVHVLDLICRKQSLASGWVCERNKCGKGKKEKCPKAGRYTRFELVFPHLATSVC